MSVVFTVNMTKKTTHTIHDIDALLLEKVILLKTAKTMEERIKLNQQIKRLEKHFNDCNEKHINGLKGYTEEVPPKVTKKELLELIDSVPSSNDPRDVDTTDYIRDLDLSGVSPGKNRFIYTD